jgi:hypothetical protein
VLFNRENKPYTNIFVSNKYSTINLKSISMKTFLCKTCNQKFEAEGIMFSWTDPIYGPSTKYTATCPCNGEVCEEIKPLNNRKEEFALSGSSCGTGGCSCKR